MLGANIKNLPKNTKIFVTKRIYNETKFFNKGLSSQVINNISKAAFCHTTYLQYYKPNASTLLYNQNKIQGLFTLNHFSSPENLETKTNQTLDSLSRKLKLGIDKVLNKNKKEVFFIELMDEISNELCSLIDGASAINTIYEDKKMKEACIETIMKVSAFMTELNQNKLLYNCLLEILFSDSVMSGSLNNTETEKLLIRMIYELGLMKKENKVIEECSEKGKISSILDGSMEDTFFMMLNELESNHDSDDKADNNKNNSDRFIIFKHELDKLASIGLKSYLSILVENYEHVNNQNVNNNLSSDTPLYIDYDIEVLYMIIKKSNSESLSQRALSVIKEKSLKKLPYLCEILRTRIQKVNLIANVMNSNDKTKTRISYNDYQLANQTVQINPNKLISILEKLKYNITPNIVNELITVYDYFTSPVFLDKNLKDKDYIISLLNQNTPLNYVSVEYLKSRYLELQLQNYSDNQVNENTNNIIEKNYITINNLLDGLKLISDKLFDIELDYVLEENRIQEKMIHQSVLKCVIRRKNINKKKEKYVSREDDDDIDDQTILDKLIKEQSYDDDVIGNLYFDFFIRDGKSRDTFAHLTIQGSKLLNKKQAKYYNIDNKINSNFIIHQKPISIISTNFEVTNRDLLNMSISFSNCKDVFHEFGHSMHSLLSETEYQSLSGTRIPLDFAEIPSHFFEKFVFDYDFCKLWMVDRNTEIPINRNLFTVLAKECLGSFETSLLLETVYHSIIDLKMHSFTNENDVKQEAIEDIISRNHYFPNYNFVFNSNFVAKFKSIYNNEEELSDNKKIAYLEFEDEYLQNNSLKNKTDFERISKKRIMLKELMSDCLQTNKNEDIINLSKYEASEELSYVSSSHLKDYPSCYYSYVVGKLVAEMIWLKIQHKDYYSIGKLLREEFLSKGFNQNPAEFITKINKI